MKILVTGGAGFIASHIVDAYINAGHRIIVVDNLSSGFRKNLNPKAVFYKADITNARAIETIFKKEKPEVVNHHAAVVEIIKSLRDPLPTLTVNILGTANLLAQFARYGTGKNKKFIFASTGGALYGEPRKIPANESTPILPLSPYGLSKKLAEDTIRYYGRMHNFDYFILRYANVYGPRQNPKGEAGVVAIFSGLMKKGITPTIFGDGTKSRDYVYVGDIAHANLLATKRGKNDAVNIGSGKTISDQKIFDTIANVTGFTGKPNYAPYRKGEVYRISLDAQRAKRILGWNPSVKFEEGISRTAATI
mgnify:CR=1 FL=1